MDSIFILVLALILDLIIGELPNKYHPVAWLGKLIDLEVKFIPGKGKVIQFISGMIGVLTTIGLIAVSIFYLLSFFLNLDH